jgi:hypothetical protein
MPQEYDVPGCCVRGNLFITWQMPGKNGHSEGPDREGWAMPLADYFLANVNYCPFCGKKLECEEG